MLLIFSCSSNIAGQRLCRACEASAPPEESNFGAALSTDQDWRVVSGPFLGEEGQCCRFGACESQESWAEPGSDCISQGQPDSLDD